MTGYYRITKSDFYSGGGFSNTMLKRVMRSGKWCYYCTKTEHSG